MLKSNFRVQIYANLLALQDSIIILVVVIPEQKESFLNTWN